MASNYSTNITFRDDSHLYPRSPSHIEVFLSWMSLYYTPAVIVIGVLGNLLSSLVLLLSKLRKFSSSHYLACVVLTNTLYSLVTLLIWMRQLHINTYDRPFMCQVVSLIKDISSFLSLWILVAFVVDRYVAICWPTEASRFCTVMRARIVIAGLTIFCMVIYLNTSLTVAVFLERTTNRPRCRPLELDDKSMMVLDILDMTLNHILAFCSIIILYILICRNLFCCCNNDLKISDSGTHFSLLTLVYVMWFLFCHLPAEVIYLHLTSLQLYRIQTNLPNGYNYAFHIVQHFADTAKATNIFIFIFVHPLFYKYLKNGVFKFSVCFVKCFRRKDKQHIEEQITLKESV